MTIRWSVDSERGAERLGFESEPSLWEDFSADGIFGTCTNAF